MIRMLKALAADESGPTAVEYALMAAGVAGVIIATVLLFGQRVNSTFTNVYEHIPGKN